MSDEYPIERRQDYLGNEFKERVLASLRDIRIEVANVETKIDDLKDHEISNMKVELGMLKVKAGVWGLIGSALGMFLMLAGKKLGL